MRVRQGLQPLHAPRLSMAQPPPLPRNDPLAVAWFQGLTAAYRKQARSVPKVVLQRVHASQRLGRKTQFAHIWLKLHPPLDCHLVVVTHFSDRPDKHVESWGPIEPKDLERTLAEFDAMEWYHRPVVKRRRGPVWDVPIATQHGLLHESIDIHVRGLYDDIRIQHLHPREREDGELYLQEVAHEFGVCRFHGNLLGRNPEATVNYFFREAAENVRRIREYKRERRNQPPPTYPPEPPTSGYTAVLFPIRHIGKNPAKTISERFWGKHPWAAPGNVVIDRTYNGVRALATYEGHIGVVIGDQDSARNFLNMVCYALRKAGTPTAYLRPRDLGAFTLRPEKETELEFRSYSYNPDDRPSAAKGERIFGASMAPISKVDRAFRRAVKLVKDPDLESYSDLLEAESQLEEERFRQAFFLAWTLVERRLGEVWELLLLKAVGESAQPAVSVEWKATVIAGGLMRVGMLTVPLGSQLRELNRKRNQILHGKVATKKDAESMFAAANAAVRELRLAQSRLRRKRRR